MATRPAPHPRAPSGPKERLTRRWPELALLGPALLAAVIYQGGLAFWLGVTLVLLSAWVLARITQSGQPFPPLDLRTVPLLGFWLWGAATAFWSPAPMVSLYAALGLLALPLGYLGGFSALASGPERTRTVYALVVAVGLVLAALSFNEARLGILYPSSLFLNKNTHAGFLNPVLLLAAGLYLNGERRWTVALLGTAVFLIALSAGLPASRGALAGLIIGFALLAAVAWAAGSRWRLAAAFVLVASGYVLGGSYSELSGRLAAVADAEAGAAGRWYIWEGALRTLEAAPWYGNGLGTFWLVYPPFQHPLDPSAGWNPHNDFLELLIDTGIPGLVLLLVLAAGVIRLGRGLLVDGARPAGGRIEAAALLGAVLAVGTHSLFSHNLYHPSFALLLGLFLGRLEQLGAARTRALGPPARLALGTALGALLLMGVSMIVSSALLARAFEARDSGRLDGAERLVSLVRTWLPSDDRAAWLEARIDLDRALAATGASASEQAEAYGQILRHLAAAEALNPLRPSIPLLRAEAGRQLRKGADPQPVLSDYARALRLDPRYVQARQGYAETLLEMGRVAEAHRVLVEGLKHDYEPLTALPGYLELTLAVTEAVGDAHNAERAQRALARFERELERLDGRRPAWGLPRPSGPERTEGERRRSSPRDAHTALEPPITNMG